MLSLAAGPALAAAPVSQATARAAQINILGTALDTGTYAVTNDGSGQKASGTNKPALSLLQGQGLAGVGTLAQDAKATVVNNDGHSAACAGLAGDGASVAAVGDSNCLTGGDNVSISAGSLDLSNLSIAGGALGNAIAPLDPLIDGIVRDAVLVPVTNAVSGVLDGLGNPGLALDLGTIQSHCTAVPGTAKGGAEVADLKLILNLPDTLGGPVTVVDLPVTTAPNTKVTAGALLTAVLNGLKVQIKNGVTTSLTTQLQALAGLQPLLDQLNLTLSQLIDTLQTQIVNGVLAQLETALQPLTSQILQGTINKQTSTGPGQIDVTALDLHVLPVLGSNDISLNIANVTCGPNGRITPVVTPAPPASVPTAIDAGAGTADGSDPAVFLAAFAGLLAIAAGGGSYAYRRHLALVRK